MNVYAFGFLVLMLTIKVGTSASPTPPNFGLDISEMLKDTFDALRPGKKHEYLTEISQIIAYLQDGETIRPNSERWQQTVVDKLKQEAGMSNAGIEVTRAAKATSEGSNGEAQGERLREAIMRKLAGVISATGGDFRNGTLNSLGSEPEKETKFDQTDVKTVQEVDYEAMGCGLKNVEAVQARILGGEVASYGEWPWQVALVHIATGRAFCGASLLNTRFLLTAGHCASLLPPRSFQAWLGSHVLSRHREKHRVVRGISHVIIHKDFIRRTLKNDIALLRMDEAVQISRNIRPVCLPDVLEWDKSLYDGSDTRMGIVTGWGLTKEKGNRSPVLLQAKLPFLNVSECQKRYKRINTVSEQMLCTLDNTTVGVMRDSCKGDSGGPLVTVGAEGRWTQVGVVSFGYGCGRKGYPGVYTRITQYLLWIYLKIVQIEISILS